MNSASLRGCCSPDTVRSRAACTVIALSGDGHLHDAAILSLLSHILGGKLVAFLHQGNLLVNPACLLLSFLQFGSQFLHLPFQILFFLVHFRRFVKCT